MTADELNRRLAEALGWKYDAEYGEAFKYLQPGHRISRKFNPGHRVDDLRDYVLPEVVKRKRWNFFQTAVHRAWEAAPDDEVAAQGMFSRYLLMADPAVLAEAALKALEGKGKNVLE